MTRQRLDQALVERGLVSTRSQAESYVKLGNVLVDGRAITKPGHFVGPDSKIKLTAPAQYVSRAALKLAGAAEAFQIDFKDKTVLDVGSSTGGFTDFALRAGAKKVIAVDVGSNQLHQSLRSNPKIELHEKTDIRSFVPKAAPDIILIDVSFISLREVLPHLADISADGTVIIAMFKPQFEAGAEAAHKGIIKNDRIRRGLMKDFETWTKKLFTIAAKADSEVSGSKGNRERFYVLKSHL